MINFVGKCDVTWGQVNVVWVYIKRGKMYMKDKVDNYELFGRTAKPFTLLLSGCLQSNVSQYLVSLLVWRSMLDFSQLD